MNLQRLAEPAKAYRPHESLGFLLLQQLLSIGFDRPPIEWAHRSNSPESD